MIAIYTQNKQAVWNYADIECDSNLTACYDVLAVIQQIKRPSTVIERIERGVYEEVAECRMSNLIDRPETHEKCTETHACDLIRRQAAIDALDEIESEVADGYGYQYEKWRKYFCGLPSAQPETHEERTETHACDLIDRQEAIDAEAINGTERVNRQNPRTVRS